MQMMRVDEDGVPTIVQSIRFYKGLIIISFFDSELYVTINKEYYSIGAIELLAEVWWHKNVKPFRV